MKAKTAFQIPAILLILFIGATAKSQQQKLQTPNPSTGQSSDNSSATAYTYRVFQAPNKNFGYDIVKDGKIVYHEFASLSQPAQNSNPPKLNNQNTAVPGTQNLALSKKEHAEMAALLAIEKIKKGEPPVLSQDEIRKIISQ